MQVALELASLRELHEGRLLKHRRIALDEVEDGGLKHHVARIDRCAVLHRLLAKRMHGVVVADVEDALLLLLHDRRQCRRLAVRLVEAHEFANVDVRHTVAVGHHESLVLHILADAPDAPACQSVKSRIDDRDLPRLRVLIVHDHAVFLREVKRDVGRVQEVVGEPLLDHVLLVARAYNELIEAEVTVALHDVPEDRHAADLDHRLGSPFRLLRDARAEAARQKHCFQIFISLVQYLALLQAFGENTCPYPLHRLASCK